MNVFWQTPEPLTVSQLSRLLVGQDWSKNYIHKVLRWLSDKEFIKVVGIAQEGRYQAQQYVPTLTKDEYLAYMLEEQGVNNSLFARIAVTLFKKDKKQRTPEQDEKLIAELRAKGYDVVTEVTQATTFWPAEEYHQDYYDRKGTQPYCHGYTKRF